MNIFDNHEHYNKFQSIEGMRANSKNAVSGYILECKLKKIIRQHVTYEILQTLTNLKNKKNRKQIRFISTDDLIYKAEKTNSNTLQECIELFETEGILESLKRLLQLKK